MKIEHFCHFPVDVTLEGHYPPLSSHTLNVRINWWQYYKILPFVLDMKILSKMLQDSGEKHNITKAKRFDNSLVEGLSNHQLYYSTLRASVDHIKITQRIRKRENRIMFFFQVYPLIKRNIQFDGVFLGLSFWLILKMSRIYIVRKVHKVVCSHLILLRVKSGESG